MTAMYAEDWEARAEAYTEAAEHLLMEWTNDTRERRQGQTLNRFFRNEAEKCRRKAERAPSIATLR